jgi:ABC-type multidrug transport system ATPase subunit
LLDRLGLEEKRRTKYSQLSTGQQRRLALSLAIAHDPPVLILDEPTAGLDVATRAELHALMQELKEQGRTIILATHDMAEAEKLADRVSILLRGKIVATGPIDLTATARVHQGFGAHEQSLEKMARISRRRQKIHSGRLCDLFQHRPRPNGFSNPGLHSRSGR